MIESVKRCVVRRRGSEFPSGMRRRSSCLDKAVAVVSRVAGTALAISTLTVLGALVLAATLLGGTLLVVSLGLAFGSLGRLGRLGRCVGVANLLTSVQLLEVVLECCLKSTDHALTRDLGASLRTGGRLSHFG